MRTFWVVLLAMAMALPACATDWAGGITFTGQSSRWTVGGSTRVCESPPVYLDLLYAPEISETMAGLSVPIRLVLDPLADLCGISWSPAAANALERVHAGFAGWQTEDSLPGGGLYFRVTALEWTW